MYGMLIFDGQFAGKLKKFNKIISLWFVKLEGLKFSRNVLDMIKKKCNASILKMIKIKILLSKLKKVVFLF